MIKSRNYKCYSPMCDGEVQAVDTVPKPEGRAAECWCCGSDLYTVPRYGAPDDAVAANPKVSKMMLRSSVPATSINNWQAAFTGLFIPRPNGAQSD